MTALDRKLSPEYLLRSLSSSKVKFTKFTTNTAKQALNMGNIREIMIQIPPANLQEDFASISEKFLVLSDNLKKRAFDSNNLFNSLTQRAFRGEL